MAAAVLFSCTSAAAQNPQPPEERAVLPVAVEAVLGHAIFADDSPIHHSVWGFAAPMKVTERLAVGPEVLRMIGPGRDRDWVLSGSIWYDLASPTPRPGKIVPYVTAGAGLLSHSDQFGSYPNFYFGGGGGIRVFVTDRVSVGAEFQAGSELHVRTVARIGYHIPSSPR